jgi:hypothetical protein
MSQANSVQPPVPSTEVPNKGRVPNGRFGPGNRFGRGNPFDRKVAEYRGVVLAAATDEDRQKCSVMLIAASKSGDVAAAKVLLEILFGKPRRLKASAARRLREWMCLRHDAVRTEADGGNARS